jgi:divalent metal cation (Fe/Co/Zn/Cd) transporter
VSWWGFIRQSRTPELPVVLLEDAGALFGLFFALLGVGLSMITGDPVWDGIGTVMIGVLLGIIAIILIVEMKSLLIGEGATPQELDTILAELSTGSVQRVIHIRTQYLGPDELLVAAKIALDPQLGLSEIASAIDDAEQRIRDKVHTARLIYLEPDLDRSLTTGA